MGVRSRGLAAVIIASGTIFAAAACSTLLGLEDFRRGDGGERPEEAGERGDGTDGADGGGANSSPTYGCTWCLDHSSGGFCWDFDCTDADAGPLLNGWLEKHDDAEVGVTAGSSLPNAFLSRVTGQGRAILYKGFQRAGTETVFSFDSRRISCTPNGGHAYETVAYVTFATSGGNPVLLVELLNDPQDQLVGYVGCNSCSATDNHLRPLGVKSSQDWARLSFAVSRGPQGAVTMKFGDQIVLTTNLPPLGNDDTKVDVSIGLARNKAVDDEVAMFDGGFALDGCEWAYDNVKLDFH
jgi:hypothetical protein